MADFFADLMEVRISDVPENPTVVLSFGLSLDGPQYRERILLSEASAKKLVLILKKLVKKREGILGYPIPLDEAFYRKLEVAPEDF